MNISNKELIVLIEALKSTTAYVSSQDLARAMEGKVKASKEGVAREKGDLIFALVETLQLVAVERENAPVNHYFDLFECLKKKEVKETIYEHQNKTVQMPTL